MAENSTACNSGVVKFSYSQNFEDVYIDRVFSDVSDGFYIDVGAYHPDDDSVTKYFYDKGWSGINIEPGPNFDTLATRTRDINLKIAISSKSGQEKFVFDQLAPGTSRIIHDTDTDADSEGVTVVDCMSLDELVHRYAPHRKIHFLKLDIEGEENAVILSTNWEVVRPELLVVESTIPFTNTRCDDGWRDHLMRSGYHDVFFDGINVYFLRTESLHRASDLNRPVNVLDNFVKFGAAEKEVGWLRERHRSNEAALANAHADYHWLKSQYDDTQAEAIWLTERREAADAALAAAQNDYLWLKSQTDDLQAEAIWQKERREAADSALSALQNDYLWLKSEYDIMLKEMNTLRDCRDNLKKSTFA
jgi:FkbM family methyltransferase